jgi:uncharacterized protein (TIGR02246 family)
LQEAREFDPSKTNWNGEIPKLTAASNKIREVSNMKLRSYQIGLIVIGLVPTSFLNAQTLSKPDEMAIRAIVKAVPEALNKKDMKMYADLFADDADWINVVGMHWRGKAAVVKAHEVYLKTVFRDGGMSNRDITIRAVTPDVAIAVVIEDDKGGGILPDGSKPSPGSGRLTYVLVKRGGKWKITHGHNTHIDPDAQPFDPINSNWSGETPKQ